MSEPFELIVLSWLRRVVFLSGLGRAAEGAKGRELRIGMVRARGELGIKIKK
jgi:hypothetical protein